MTAYFWLYKAKNAIRLMDFLAKEFLEPAIAGSKIQKNGKRAKIAIDIGLVSVLYYNSAVERCPSGLRSRS